MTEYEIDWNTGMPTIWLFQRLKNGEKEITKIKDFEPYFYVETAANVGDDSMIYKSIFNETVKKVIVKSPKDVYPLRQHLEDIGMKHYEADVLYNNRFLIDEVEEIIPSTYKKFYLDIETLSEGGFPDVDNTNQPIICMTIYNSFNKKYISWIWRDDFLNEVVEMETGEIRKFTTEEGMLQNIINYVSIEQPDVWLAWNGVYFDYKYLLNRMKNIYNLNIRRLSPINSAFVTKNKPGMVEGKEFKGVAMIKGIVLFDLLNYYRKVHKGELSSYSLNNVAEEELGEQKTDSHHVVDKDWKDDWMNVIRYNKKDVELCVKIDKKTGVYDFFDQMRTIAHVNVDDCKYYGRVVDTFILRYAKQKSIVLPSKKKFELGGKLEGGFVMEPSIGLHKNVIVIDLNQIYPSLIETFNLSAETKVDDGEININGIKFSKKTKGMIPSVLDELGRLRKRFKSKMKELRYDDPDFKTWDMKQQAAKNLACTVYGVNALSSFRLHNDYVAQSITYLGRRLINWIKDKVEEKGYEVLYCDTDSNFIKFPDEFTEEECIEKGKELAQYINDNVGEFAKQFGVTEHTLAVDFEKLYRNYLLMAKKRYVGHVVWKDGEKDDAIQMIGVDAKRSDSSTISKSLQKDLFKMILKEESKENIVNYIEDIINNIKSKPYTDIAIPVKFEKGLDEYMTNIPRVRAAKWSNRNINTNYGAGNKVLMVYTKEEPDCICFEENYQLEDINVKIDYEKMIDKLVIMKVRKIFDAIGWKSITNNLVTKYLNNNMLLTDFIR